jgi:hypothetical protein
MRHLAEIIGWLCIACAIFAAMLPNMEFHVYFGDSAGAIKWHNKYQNKQEGV